MSRVEGQPENAFFWRSTLDSQPLTLTVAQVGFEPTASPVLSQGGLPLPTEPERVKR
jgi:hypothetical protein